ncbi:LapA family protein [Psychromonas sp. KJ10-10]|uniref:LapA family protein n=1 Tax=Psychromonas sp. KJ10-10 TaxID=3391823 RepID=UPI0039B3B2AE
MKRFILLVLLVLLFIIAIVLGLKNQQTVNINYILAQSDIRLSTLLAINFMLGFIVSACIGMLFYLRLMMKTRNLRKLNKNQRKELSLLRATDTKD